MRPRAADRRKGTGTKQEEVDGYDGGKKVKGRKRHLIVDSQGLIVGVLVTEGNTPERLGAAMVVCEHKEELSDTEVIWVDGGYSGQNFARVVRQICGASVEVIKRISKTFEMRKALLFQSSKTTICAYALYQRILFRIDSFY